MSAADELRAPHYFCSVLHFRLIIGIYFLTVHGRSLSVSDQYWTADSEAADFTGSVRSNFGWIVRPLVINANKCVMHSCYVDMALPAHDVMAYTTSLSIDTSTKDERQHYLTSAGCSTCWQPVIGNILILWRWHLSWHTGLETHHIRVLWCTKPYKKNSHNINKDMFVFCQHLVCLNTADHCRLNHTDLSKTSIIYVPCRLPKTKTADI